MKAFQFFLLCAVIFFTSACEKKSDEERLIKDINRSSVFLSTGLKVLIANPHKNPELDKAKVTLEEILHKNSEAKLSAEEIFQLGKIGLLLRSVGKDEVSRGQKSDFVFLPHLFPSLQIDAKPLNPKQDHALTLIGLHLLKLYPHSPLPVSNKTLLYEAWMADDAQLSDDLADDFVHAAQASVFASNDYCDLAEQQAHALVSTSLAPVDGEVLANALSASLGLGHLAAHAPDSAALLLPLLAAPALLELAPGLMRIYALHETAACLNRQGEKERALMQYQQVLETLSQWGIPAEELALLHAALAYKQNDLPALAYYLKQCEQSRLLDARSKSDLQALAASIENPDKNLLERYFSDSALALTLGKIVHQRLLDEGVYQSLLDNKEWQRGIAIYESLQNSDVESLKEKGKDLWQATKNAGNH